MKYFDKTIKIDPNYAIGWHNKGVCLINLKKYKEALMQRKSPKTKPKIL